MLGTLYRSRSPSGLQLLRFYAPRCISTDREVKTLNENNKFKRFAKVPAVRELKPFNENFVFDLFTGKFNKDILQYPSIVNENELSSLLAHSSEVENCFRDFLERNVEINKDVIENLTKLELFGLTVPQEYGGLGYTETEAKFIQECTGIYSKIGRFLSNNNEIGAKIILKYGSESQKQKYLPRLTSGSSFISLAVLEDQPIATPAAINSVSVVDEVNKGFLISGTKKWVLNADISDLFLVLTKGTIFGEDCISKFNLFIAEKNTPGVTVYKLKSNSARELGLCEIDFKNVFLPNDSMINRSDECAFSIAKYGISESALTSAVLCLSLMKRMFHSLLQHCDNEFMSTMASNQNSHVRANLVFLTVYIYALESVVYLISGRSDLHEHPDLFVESCIAKILATDMLNLSVRKYIEVIGRDCYKSPSVLEEAFKLLQCNSVFEESNLHLKLMIGCNGTVHSTKTSREKIYKKRDGVEYPVEYLKFKIFPDKSASNDIKEELHVALKKEADVLQSCLKKFEDVVASHIVWNGNKSLEYEDTMEIFAEIAVYIYTLTACLARSSNSYCDYVKNAHMEMDMVKLYTNIFQSKIQALCDKASLFSPGLEALKSVAKDAFISKEYPIEHPLSRAF